MSDETLPKSARRTVLKALGMGAALLSVGTGHAAAAGNQRPATIDENLGYTQWDPDAIVPFRNKVDETVTLGLQNPGEARVPGPAEFFFDPVGLHIEPGTVVEFSVNAGHHAIASYNEDNDRQRRIPADASSFSSPMLGGYGNDDGPPEKGGDSQSWFYEFETEGVYDMYCPPHEVFGMVMRIVVGDATETDVGPTGIQFLGPLEFANDIFAQPELEPENIREAGSVGWDDLFPLEETSEE